MPTEEVVFSVNRRWVFFYIASMIVCDVVVALIFMSGFYALRYQSKSTGDVIIVIIGMLMFMFFFFVILAFAQSLIKTMRAGGPALIISDEGFRYRFASDALVPWGKIKRAGFYYQGMGRKRGVRIELNRDFSETLHWRGAIVNSYKPENINVSFLFIDAPNTEVEGAFLRYQVLSTLL